MYEPTLSDCPLFSGIGEKILENFISETVSEIRTFQKGEHVVRQGEPIAFLYLLTEGIVRTEMITAEGNLVEIEFIAFQFLIGKIKSLMVVTSQKVLMLFQFLIGKIKSGLQAEIDKLQKEKFQFLIGKIKSMSADGEITADIMFQFLIGKIKSNGVFSNTLTPLSFNSS